MTDPRALEKILVIDDEQSTLKMLRLLLKTYDYSVLMAESGESGLEIFRKECPPIVLTDVRMPGMNGIEVLRRLKEMDADVEVIVITGHGDMEMAVHALQLDASDFINKPIHRLSLEIALHRAEERIRLKRRIKEYTHELEARVAEATAELERSYRRLEALYEISRAVGETASLGGIVTLLEEKIGSLTQLRCVGLVVLSSGADAILKGEREDFGGIVGRERDLIVLISELEQTLPLSDEQKRDLFRMPSEFEASSLHLVPILREGSGAIGAALVSVAREGSEDDLRLVSFLLSQASGAIWRSMLHEEELRSLRCLAEAQDQFGELTGRHEKIQQVYRLVANIAYSDATVLIQGESGTGKELVARRIHEMSPRREAAFIVINCAAYPETLIESELFGYEKGAFTGAARNRKGSFELAQGGTIFLDEIGEISPAVQVKLLRVLQFKEFQRLGGAAPVKLDVRVLAATSRNLRKEMEMGTFREDLYYRLHVIPIVMPPLRERMSDLPLLVDRFLTTLSGRGSKMVRGLEPDVLEILMNHHWPGNIRELENVIEHAFILARGDRIKVADLPAYLRAAGNLPGAPDESLSDMEREHLIRVLSECKGNKIRAARRLKISRSTLYRKLEQYKLLE